MKKLASHLVILSTVILLAACQANIPQENFPEMTFKHLPAIQMRVVD
ncbi:MAG: hypothetical protein HON14_08035, partial [Rhodospirillaceae bacterium]|nr:hypothetical protein [Rhodospirillaceae bacterium]